MSYGKMTHEGSFMELSNEDEDESIDYKNPIQTAFLKDWQSKNQRL